MSKPRNQMHCFHEKVTDEVKERIQKIAKTEGRSPVQVAEILLEFASTSVASSKQFREIWDVVMGAREAQAKIVPAKKQDSTKTAVLQ